ncbi:C2H2-type zinc finger protein Ecym_2301 [Eremothecium cymbalariae DBVPG|uniref:C2H2-type domain-containing protein n=1 Tax=Eremothecium cymbalariae (strain CBS 270.75 / DBVPG 7215 / KCTC 17166 / NRRL Y-17582) TaxID=931890 RepID=G8JQ41_ERECY|nr:Hypothetical protein Ecym_2301 [Eremothecium cymbalariae DBVPG\
MTAADYTPYIQGSEVGGQQGSNNGNGGGRDYHLYSNNSLNITTQQPAEKGAVTPQQVDTPNTLKSSKTTQLGTPTAMTDLLAMLDDNTAFSDMVQQQEERQWDVDQHRHKFATQLSSATTSGNSTTTTDLSPQVLLQQDMPMSMASTSGSAGLLEATPEEQTSLLQLQQSEQQFINPNLLNNGVHPTSMFADHGFLEDHGCSGASHLMLEEAAMSPGSAQRRMSEVVTGSIPQHQHSRGSISHQIDFWNLSNDRQSISSSHSAGAGISLSGGGSSGGGGSGRGRSSIDLMSFKKSPTPIMGTVAVPSAGNPHNHQVHGHAHGPHAHAHHAAHNAHHLHRGTKGAGPATAVAAQAQAQMQAHTQAHAPGALATVGAAASASASSASASATAPVVSSSSANYSLHHAHHQQKNGSIPGVNGTPAPSVFKIDNELTQLLNDYNINFNPPTKHNTLSTARLGTGSFNPHATTGLAGLSSSNPSGNAVGLTPRTSTTTTASGTTVVSGNRSTSSSSNNLNGNISSNADSNCNINNSTASSALAATAGTLLSSAAAASTGRRSNSTSEPQNRVQKQRTSSSLIDGSNPVIMDKLYGEVNKVSKFSQCENAIMSDDDDHEDRLAAAKQLDPKISAAGNKFISPSILNQELLDNTSFDIRNTNSAAATAVNNISVPARRKRASVSKGPRSSTSKSSSPLDEEEKPFKCQECTKAFRRSEHLKRHIRSVHSTDRPFPCTYCDKKFSRSDNLSQHLKTHRKHGDIKDVLPMPTMKKG